MLLVDDILFSPIKGIEWMFKKIHELAQEELSGEADRIRESLTELYMQLETGEITEAEFEEQEAALLDRLDALDEEDDLIGDLNSDDDEEDEEEEDNLYEENEIIGDFDFNSADEEEDDTDVGDTKGRTK